MLFAKQEAGDACAGGRAAGARRARVRDPGAPRGAGHADPATVPRGDRAGRLRARLLLGRRAAVLAAPGVYTTAVGYRAASRRTRPTRRSAPAAPGTPRPCWSSSTRGDRATKSCSSFFGEATTPPRACARATTSARSTARRSTTRATSSRRPRCRASRTSEALKRAGHGGDHHGDRAGAGRSTTRRTTTSSTSHKVPNGYCGLAGTGVSLPDRHRRHHYPLISAQAWAHRE